MDPSTRIPVQWWVMPVVIGLLAFCTAAVVADHCHDDPPVDPRAQAARQREAERAQRAVHDLWLNRRQAQRILPIVERAVVLRVEAYQTLAAMLPDMVEAYSDFAMEDRLNQGFSPEIERRTNRVHRQAKDVRESLSEQMIGLEKEVSQVLSPSQRRLVNSDKKKDRSRGRDRLAKARRQLKEVRAEVHPRPGKLGEYLFHPAAGIALGKIARVKPPETIEHAAQVLEHGTEEHPMWKFDQQQAEVRQLRTEINNWNLINGLHLSSEQVARIVALYDQGAPRIQEARRKRGATPEQKRAPLIGLERAVEETLNVGQRQVLAEYKPCLVPPKNLKDPVRIGQATDNSGMERWLTRARKAPEARLEKMAEGVLARQEERFGSLPPAQRRERKALLIATAREAAAMSDVDFELDKADLALKIAPRDLAEELRTEIDSMARDRGLAGPIARFMLKPEFIDQLRERSYQMIGGT